MEYTIYKAKQCLLNVTNLTVDCEETTWLSPNSLFSYRFIKIGRQEEVKALRDFLELYSQLSEILTHSTSTEQPEPLKITNINYKIKITNENLIGEIRNKISIFRVQLTYYPFQNYNDLRAHQNSFFNISIEDFKTNTENILDLFNDVCTLKYFYRKKNDNSFLKQNRFQKLYNYILKLILSNVQ